MGDDADRLGMILYKLLREARDELRADGRPFLAEAADDLLDYVWLRLTSEQREALDRERPPLP